MTSAPLSSPAHAASGGEVDAWLPPDAPLAMPRQALELNGAAEGVLATLFRLIFAPLRG
ncbi:hypothetical protein [Pseudooceanicola sp.]|uniref:hypothetical protein n=1 Tax=Pseudooceanicola sp. TaxID=1914328 RepID=UPI0040599AE1